MTEQPHDVVIYGWEKIAGTCVLNEEGSVRWNGIGAPAVNFVYPGDVGAMMLRNGQIIRVRLKK
jgi:hypothetical protein